MVYVGSEDGKIYALNTANGAKIWSYSTSGYVESSPTVVDGVLYIASLNGKIYSLGSLPPSSNSSLVVFVAVVIVVIVLSGVFLYRKKMKDSFS